MIFSVIIPTFNEESNIKSCLESVLKNTTHNNCNLEILVIDGNSCDETVKIVRDIISVCSQKIILVELDSSGLAKQLNRGAALSSGEVIVFLHADCRLPEDAFIKIKNIYEKVPDLSGGAFTMSLDGRKPFYRFYSFSGNLYSRAFKIFFGDRAIFVKRKIFNSMGGFKDLKIMSDVEFSLRLKKKGKVRLVKGPVLSSNRKFEKEAFFETIYLQLWTLWAFKRGLDQEIIFKKYYHL